MFDRFSDRSKKVMSLARQAAQRLDHEYLGTEHVLLGILDEEGGAGVQVLAGLGLDGGKIRAEVDKVVERGRPTVTLGQLPFTPRTKKVLEHAMEESTQLHHGYISTGHLLLGLLREEDGIAGKVLRALGLEMEAARTAVIALHASREGPEPSAKRDGLPFVMSPLRLEGTLGRVSARLESVWSLARRKAVSMGHIEIAPSHALYALLVEEKGTAAHVLRTLGVDPVRARGAVAASLAPPRPPIDPALVALDERLDVVLALALEEARTSDREVVDTVHLLMGLLREGGAVAQLLAAHGVTIEKARATMLECFRRIDEDPIWDLVG